MLHGCGKGVRRSAGRLADQSGPGDSFSKKVGWPGKGGAGLFQVTGWGRTGGRVTGDFDVWALIGTLLYR